MDLDLLKNNALAFKKSAERCLEPKKQPGGGYEFFAVPAVVNLAFSVELYLKFILIKKGKSHKGHELFKLFKLLDDPTKEAIIKATNYDQITFESMLTNHTATFVEWRYMHEENRDMRASTEFMMKLATSIENVANSL